MFQCSRCFHLNFSTKELLCKFCGNEGATGAAGMEIRKLSDFQNMNFGSNEPEENAFTANEASPDSSFEIALASLDKYLLETNSIADSEAPTHTFETPFPRSYGCDQLCDTVRPMDLNFALALPILKDFDMSSGSTDKQFLKDTVHILDEERSKKSPPPKNCKSEMYAATFQGISNEGKQLAMHYDEAMKMDATFPIIIDNIYIPSTSWELLREIFDTGSYTGQVARYLDNIPKVPGPSGIQRNAKIRNSCVETSKSAYSNKLCNVCKKEYAEEYLHQYVCKCSVCNKKFRCRTLYNEHLLDHPDYFKTRCWVCLH